MEIKSIKLNNFRNYDSSKVEFKNGVNFIVGDNAQGKTNLIEAIYVCALGKSFKNIKEKLLINFNASMSRLDVDFSTLAGNKSITIILNSMMKKTVKINAIPISKLTELVGTLNVVLFSPDELKLVKEVPEDRRRFLDISISQFDKLYMFKLMEYDKILKQRNCVLKSKASNETKIEQLKIWTPQLIRSATEIIQKRINFIQKLNCYANSIHSSIKENENLTIQYSFNEADIKSSLEKSFKENLEKELIMGHTLTGPHRDDIILNINGKDCKFFASQGQQRTVALCLKLSLMEIIKEYKNEYPVLLMDDVLSELDEARQIKLLDIVSKYQTIITSTDVNQNFKNYNIINISDIKK